jgi:hypothetical protein
VDVYVEKGKRRVFAAAVDWPGWCRSGKDEHAALEALEAYAPRYARAIGRTARSLSGPMKVVERLRGDATTDFGAPGTPPKADARALGDAELRKLVKILEACWHAFDAAAKAAAGVELTKGPRGGGRDVGKMIAHVLEAERAYASRLAARGIGAREMPSVRAKQMAHVRAAFVDALRARAHGEPLDKEKKTWSPRYAIRRSAWHALDHAWEIEDRTPRQR